MKKLNITIQLLFLLCFGAILQLAALSSTFAQEITVKAADDYATTVYQDPWDMNERTDVGWFTFYTIAENSSNLSGITFQNGIFSAQSTSGDPKITLLDPDLLAAPLGKNGKTFPIDANKYRRLMVRMKLGIAPPWNLDGELFWIKNVPGAVTASKPFPVYTGWYIYSIDIPTLDILRGIPGLAEDPWLGTPVGFLRFDPTTVSGNTIEIDWIRLVDDDPSLNKTIQLPSSGPWDISLDNDTSSANGNLGKIAENYSGGSYPFYFGGLPYGTYYVVACNHGTSNCSYLSQHYAVNDIPTLKFLSPSEEGSDDDFATAQLDNPWDMDSVDSLVSIKKPYTLTSGDIDYCVNISSLTTDSIIAEDEAGRPLGSIRVLKGMSEAGAPGPLCVGDPYVYPLFFTKRGLTHHIDSNWYRILVLEMGLPGAQDLRPEPNGGSIARIVWRVFGDQWENVSEDILLNHKSGTVVIDKIIADMKTLPIELGQPNTSQSGWNGMIEAFRVDPHEFCQPREFYIKNIKLAAFERANSSYIIRWEFYDQSSAPKTISLFYDTDHQGYNGTPIANTDLTSGSYTWNTSAIPDGIYYIYAVYSNGSNSNQTYARWPVFIDHSSTPTPHISVSSTSHDFGSVGLGSPSDWTLTITNIGNAALVLGQITYPASPFDKLGDNCSGQTLELNAACTIHYQFLPEQKATFSGNSNIPSNDPGQNTLIITLTGEGISESVSSPSAPTGSSQGNVGSPYDFSASGSTSSIGDPVEYQFDWTGDGTVLSSWGVATRSNNWPTPGTYFVRARARCGDHLIVSFWSPALTVRILSAPPQVDKLPFGSLDLPSPNATIYGPVIAGGWALDDVGVTRVELRSDISFWNNGSLGDLYYTCGTRSDIAGMFSNYPNKDCAGWGIVWLTNFMSDYRDPRTGQRVLEGSTHQIYLRVYDTSGRYVDIGHRNVTIRNDGVEKPFGAINDPAPGSIVSGPVFVSGWALAKGGRRVTKVQIGLAEVPASMQEANYGVNWPVLTQFFPLSAYPYSENAAFVFILDTTLFPNGQYQLGALVTDEAENEEGIGSRFIYIQN